MSRCEPSRLYSLGKFFKNLPHPFRVVNFCRKWRLKWNHFLNYLKEHCFVLFWGFFNQRYVCKDGNCCTVQKHPGLQKRKNAVIDSKRQTPSLSSLLYRMNCVQLLLNMTCYMISKNPHFSIRILISALGFWQKLKCLDRNFLYLKPVFVF